MTARTIELPLRWVPNILPTSQTDSDQTESKPSHRSIRGAKRNGAEELPARSGCPRQTGSTLKGRGSHPSIPVSALTSVEQAGIPSLVSIYHRGDSRECISEKPKNETQLIIQISVYLATLRTAFPTSCPRSSSLRTQQ